MRSGNLRLVVGVVTLFCSFSVSDMRTSHSSCASISIHTNRFENKLLVGVLAPTDSPFVFLFLSRFLKFLIQNNSIPNFELPLHIYKTDAPVRMHQLVAPIR